MTNPRRNISIITILAALALAFAGCGDDSNPSSVSSDRVVDPQPLALGNAWSYTLEQHAYFDMVIDGSTIPIHLSSTGTQSIDITRTEAISGDEAFGLRYVHVMSYLLTPSGADTTVEVHYLAPRGNEVLLKAIESGYNTGGFIPMGYDPTAKQQPLLAKVTLNGQTRYLPLEALAAALLDPEPTEGLMLGGGTALASDGVQNRDDVYFYSYDYVMLYNELYKGRRWVCSAAQGVGGLEISRKVTNILDELGEYEGPIAEVEETNSLIESISTISYKLRFYYKGGVGIVQAEIYDSDFDFYSYDASGNLNQLGHGTWNVIKKLVDHTVK